MDTAIDRINTGKPIELSSGLVVIYAVDKLLLQFSRIVDNSGFWFPDSGFRILDSGF